MIERADSFGKPGFCASDGIDRFEPEMVAGDGQAGIGGFDKDVEVLGDVREGKSAVDIKKDDAGSGGFIGGVVVGVEIGGVYGSNCL